VRCPNTTLLPTFGWPTNPTRNGRERNFKSGAGAAARSRTM